MLWSLKFLRTDLQTYRRTDPQTDGTINRPLSLPPKGLIPRRASLGLDKIMKYLYIPDLQIVQVRIDLNYNYN